MSRAHQIVDALLEGHTAIIAKDIPPPQWSLGSDDKDVEQAARSAFTAYNHAMTTGRHHPKLWAAVRGSAFEKQYRQKFGNLAENSRPVKGGIGDKLQAKDVDSGELATGIKTEMEHTKDRNLARDIALDHLAEDPKYYSKLSRAGL